MRIEKRSNFERMYRQHEQRVLAYALRRAPIELAKDAVAETFLAAWRRFDELPADPLPWLLLTTRRTLANQRRSAVRHLRLVARLADEAAPQPTGGASAGGGGVVAEALGALAPDDQEALKLIAWEGLTPAQAAQVLGCSAVAFRVRLHRARRRFRRELADIQPEGVGFTHPEQLETAAKEAR